MSLAKYLAVSPYSSDSQVLLVSTSSHQVLSVTGGAPAAVAAATARANEFSAAFHP